MSRSEKIIEFLTKSGWGGAKISPLAGDASFRRYDRILLGEKKAVLMDAPPEFEDIRPFVTVAEYLLKSGFGAPKIYAKDFEQGFLLLEDLGDDLYKIVLEKEPEKELRLYQLAVDELTKLNDCPLPVELNLGTYDVDLMLGELSLFSDWYYPALTGKRLPFDKRSEFLSLWKDALARLDEPNECLVLRDYHAENLLDMGRGKVGLLDFQDAVIGHSAYDLVSLLQDARRDVDLDIEDKMIRYFAHALGRDENIFREHYAILGAQRNIKIIGIFARLFLRDGKDDYLKLEPRVWGLLERCLEHPALQRLKSWFDKHVPDKRHSALDAQPLYPSHAMILAAGLGKRMKPLTDNIPKPLVKVAGKEMLSHTLDALAAAGIKNAVINKHHYAEQIDQYVLARTDRRPAITLSDERDGLMDSGGGVKKALPMLGKAPFYILNSDMIWTNAAQDALSRLATGWYEDMDILMLVIKKSEAVGHDGEGDFHMDDDGRLRFRGDDPASDYYYGGMLIMRPECFDGTPDTPFSLRKIFRKVATQGRLYGLLHDGSWYHVGVPESVEQTEQLLKGE